MPRLLKRSQRSKRNKSTTNNNGRDLMKDRTTTVPVGPFPAGPFPAGPFPGDSIPGDPPRTPTAPTAAVPDLFASPTIPDSFGCWSSSAARQPFPGILARATDTPVKWEKHTTGVGSKILENMGFTGTLGIRPGMSAPLPEETREYHGEGLGKRPAHPFSSENWKN